MNAQETEQEIVPLRTVADVGTLKALADPLRLAILAALMNPGQLEMRVMSVKELAEELAEPQTKLYRHVRQLEAAGLIRVASSRLVSGILEQRYQASQRDLSLRPGLVSDGQAADEPDSVLALEQLLAAALSRFGEQYVAARRAGTIDSGEYPPEQAYRSATVAAVETRMAPARAAAVRLKLQEVLDELAGPQSDDPEAVPVMVLIGFSSPATPDAG
jgi:DNA-binding transcriptional ArsR family regulator